MKDATEVTEQALKQGAGLGWNRSNAKRDESSMDMSLPLKSPNANPPETLAGKSESADTRAGAAGPGSKPSTTEGVPKANAAADDGGVSVQQVHVDVEGNDNISMEQVLTDAGHANADDNRNSLGAADSVAEHASPATARVDGPDDAGDSTAKQDPLPPSDQHSKQDSSVPENPSTTAVTGGNFGAENPEARESGGKPSDTEKNEGGNVANGNTEAAEKQIATEKDDDDFSFLETLAEGAGATTANSRPTSALQRPKSAKSAKSAKSSKSSKSRPSSESDLNLPKLYLRDHDLLELVMDNQHNPIRLDDSDTYETLWTEEAQTLSQLQDILSNSIEISRELFDANLIKRKIIESQGVRYILVGTMRDFDHPNGEPLQLLNPETEEVVWNHTSQDALAQWDTLTKHARFVGTYCKALRILLDYQGTKLEVVENSIGTNEQALINFETREEMWNRDTTSDAEHAYQVILNESESCGRVLVKWIDDDPPRPAPIFTTIDFLLWQAECKGRNEIVFTWRGPQGKNSTPSYGTLLQAACRKHYMPRTFVVKTATNEMRYACP